MADISPVHRTVRRRVRALAAILMLSAAPMALAQTTQLDRAREAEARGELRAAQIELRNAVRAAPALAEARARLAEVSLDLGELDVAEREARAALERGYGRAEGTRLLLRVLLTQRKADDLLREFPLTEAGVPPAVAAQVAAARAQAQLILGRPDEAAQSVAAARRLGPNAPEPLVAAADLAIAQNNATQAEAEIDRALALDPTNRDALVRKAALQLQRGDADGAIDSFTRVIAMRPGDTQARLGRAELKMRRGDTRAATEDVEAALRATPNNAAAVYMRAVLQVTAQDWQRADESLQRIMPVLSNFPDGFLVLAMAKRGLGQTAQAEDAAQRHVARRPEDPRGARLLASMALEAGRPADAVAVLARLNDRGAADAESLELLATAYIASRRPADAVRTLQAAARLQPANANIQLRLAVSSFVAGDAATAVEAARAALRLASDRVEARDILAAALLAQGQVAEAEAEMQRLGAGWQSREIPATVQATLQLLRYDLAAARTSFSNVLRNHPNAVNARLGLAQIVAFEGNAAEQRRLLGEVLRIDPENAEALRRIAALSVVAGDIGTEARAVMAAAQAAAPNSPALAMTYAAVLIRTGAAARASEILANDALQGQVPGNTLALMRAEAHAAANQWAEAEAAARTALAEDPSSVAARRLLAIVLLRRGDARGAEALVNEGLRANRGDATLQQTLLGLVNQAQGADAALALADRLAADPAARPASSQLRGDMLLQLQRPEDAARAYAAAYAETPSRVLAMRLAATLTRLGRAQEAAAALDAWLAREPDDAEVLGLRAQNDLVAGQPAAAERRLSRVLELRPTDAVALNNLAWMLAERGQGNDLARARDLAERAYVLRPSAESADTLGWVLVKSGEPARAVSLLRAAAGGAGTPQLAGGIGYRLAYALNASGNQAEAREIVRRVLALEAQFPERADAERLRATLGGG